MNRFRPASEQVAVELWPHDTAWAGMAAAEGERLRGVLGDNLIVVHHVGSTAIPGIKAKPIVDLLPIVRDLDALDAKEAGIVGLGYIWRGEFGLPGRRFCVLSDAESGRRMFHVHFWRDGSGEIARHLAFRDYLRAHRDEALAYEAEKEKAARIAAHDMLAYNDAKSDWILACQKRALDWWEGEKAGSVGP